MISEMPLDNEMNSDVKRSDDLSIADALKQLETMQSPEKTDEAGAKTEKLETLESGLTLRDKVSNEIQSLVLSILKLSEEDFSPSTPLMDYGLDSIASTEIGNLFTERFNIVIPPTVFFEFQDLTSFVQYLLENHESELQNHYGQNDQSTDLNKQQLQAEQIIVEQADQGERESLAAEEVGEKKTKLVAHESLVSSVEIHDRNVIEIEDHYLLNPHAEQKVSQLLDQPDGHGLIDIETLWKESQILLQNPVSKTTDHIKQPERAFLQSMRRHTDAANIHLVNRKGKRPLEYVSYGEGPPLLMLGGLLMHYSVMWLTNIEALAAKHELIMFHMPGCGELKLHDGMSLQSLADDIAAVLDAHGIREPIPVFGCSFGGVMAQAFVLAYPERCSALAVAVSTPLAEGATDFQSLMRELQVSPNFMELNRAWPMASLPAYEKVIEGFDFRESLKTLELPALIVSGGKDQYTTSEHSKMIAKSLANSELVEFEDAGHLLTFSHYNEFNPLLLEFLDRVSKVPFASEVHKVKKPELLQQEIKASGSLPTYSIQPQTLAHAADYVRTGQQGHCVMLSDHSAQAATALRNLTVLNKPEGTDYRSYFVTSAEEALDAAIRIARHQARNKNPKSTGRTLIIERGSRWRNYFDPLNRGEKEALVPGIVFANSLIDAETRFALDQFIAIVFVGDDSTDEAELHSVYSKIQSLPAMSILLDKAYEEAGSDRAEWLSIQTQAIFDLVVHGEEIANYQAPVACVMIEKSLPNPWLMTPNEGYVRQPMASLGLTLSLTYKHCRENFYNLLDSSTWLVCDAIQGDRKATYQAHLDHGNIGYAKVANIHGFDQRFEKGYGLITHVLETHPQTDQVEKRELIDCLSNVGAAPRGQNPQDLIEEVFQVHDPENDYWQDLKFELSKRTGMDECLPASSQTSAIEQAISLSLLARPQHKKLLCFTGGAGFSMISANTAMDPVFNLFRKPFEPLYSNVIFIDPEHENVEEDLITHLRSGELACVWLETIGVEGNAVRKLPENLIQLVNQHKELGGYLIGIDETQTNLGTGQFLHSQGLITEPDVIAISTALTDALFPCGAVLCGSGLLQQAQQSNSDRIKSMLQQQANPLSAHLALHSLQKINEQGLLSNASETGHYLKQALLNLAAEYPLLKEVRGEGLVLAIEFDLTGYSAFIQQSFGYFLWGTMMRDQEQGVLMVVCPVHNQSLRVMPPLTITRNEADQIVANIKRRLEEGVEKILMNCVEYAKQRGDQRTADFLLASIQPSNSTHVRS